jgi:O-antigen ligase
MFRAGIILLPLLVVLWFLLPHKQQHYAFDFKSTAGSLRPRIRLIHYAINEFESHPVTGVGVGLRKKVDPTNLFLITLAETGVQGLIAFLAIYAVALSTAWKTHKKLSQADPRFSLVALGAALICGRFVHGLVDEYWLRGSIVWAWSAVGMMAAVYYEVRRGKPRNERSA